MSHFRRWGAVWILIVMWLGFAVLQWFTNLAEYTSDQAEHGQPFEWGQFLVYYFARFAENHSSESWQLAVQAVLIVGLSRVLFRKRTHGPAGAASRDENLVGVGCARSRLVCVNPSKRLTPGAFPAPRTVVLVHASQRR